MSSLQHGMPALRIRLPGRSMRRPSGRALRESSREHRRARAWPWRWVPPCCSAAAIRYPCRIPSNEHRRPQWPDLILTTSRRTCSTRRPRAACRCRRQFEGAINELRRDRQRRRRISEEARKAVADVGLHQLPARATGEAPSPPRSYHRALTRRAPDAAYARVHHRRSPISPRSRTSTRDQEKTREATQRDSRTIIAALPRSPNTRLDAKPEGLGVTRDQLAGKEMKVGRATISSSAPYMARGQPLHVDVTTKYQTTRHVEEGLDAPRRRPASPWGLVRKEAQTAAAVLGHNFPNSPRWYKDAPRAPPRRRACRRRTSKGASRVGEAFNGKQGHLTGGLGGRRPMSLYRSRTSIVLIDRLNLRFSRGA